MATEFLTPYQAGKVLSGVIKALPILRPNFVQGFFTTKPPVLTETVNFDREFSIKNVVGTFVSFDKDATPIQLPDFSHTEMRFAYAKEDVTTDNFDVLNQRQLGQQFGQVDVMANQALRLQAKFVEAEQRIQNLFELTSSNLALYGGYEAFSEKHPRVRYDFKRTVISTVAGLSLKLIPSVNLTTTAVTAPWDSAQTIMPVIASSGGYTAGQKAWTKALVTAGTATPVLDLVRMYETIAKRTRVAAFHMSDNAYDAFNFDVNTNYKDAADVNISSILATSRDILPQAQNVQGLNLRRYWTFENGSSVPIYTYSGIYHDRSTGIEKSYLPDGFVVGFPDKSNGVKVHGRILHPRASYNAMPRWINYWTNSKTGMEEWEVHTNFLFGHTAIDALTSWKVV